MLFKCRGTHVLWVIWDPEFDGDIHFEIWPKERSISRQTSSNKVKFQNSKFSYKNIPILSIFVSRFPKNVIYFYVRQLKMPSFKNMTSLPSPGFLAIVQSKINILLWNFVCWFFVSILMIYILFFDNVKISDFIRNYIFKNCFFKFWGSNQKISKIPDSHFVERSNLRRLAFFDCMLLQN